jgi:hypothetical protein
VNIFGKVLVQKLVFGSKVGKLKICHMSSANGAGIKPFQFIELASAIRPEENNFEY